MSKVVSPKRRPSLPLRRYPWYSFLLVADMSQGHGGIETLTKKYMTNIWLCICKVFTNMATMRIFEVISDKLNIVVQNVCLICELLIRMKKKDDDKAI